MWFTTSRAAFQPAGMIFLLAEAVAGGCQGWPELGRCGRLSKCSNIIPTFP